MKSKKILNRAFIGLLLLMLFGCASTPATSASTTTSSEKTTTQVGMDLDAAIREAATQMEARIPAGTMIALVSVASPSNAFSTQVLTRLESALVSNGKLVVVDRANLDKVREEQGFQLSGEVDDASATSIGRLLGAGAIVTGSLTDLGDVYSLTLKSINIETATVAMSYLADLAKTTRIETLLATRDAPATARTQPTVSASQPPAPAPVVQAPTPRQQISERNLIGTWKGSYVAGQGETALILTVYEERGSVIATFDFFNLPGKRNSAEGKYYMSVTYNQGREKFYLKGTQWIDRPSSYGFADLEGTITGNVFSGFLTDSSNRFSVIRQ